MDIYDILEQGEKLHDAEANAWYQGDVVGIANAQQGQRVLEDELMSESAPKSSNSRFSLALKPVLAGASLLTSAIVGAGIAKDLTPSLEDVVIYHTEDNSEDDFYAGKHVAIEPDFYARGDWNPISQASIVSMTPINIPMGSGTIDFTDVYEVSINIDNYSQRSIHGLTNNVKWDIGETHEQK